MSQPPALIGMLVSIGFDALHVPCDEDRVDVVRVSRKLDNVCGCVGGEFCVLCVRCEISCVSALEILAETQSTQRRREILRVKESADA